MNADIIWEKRRARMPAMHINKASFKAYCGAKIPPSYGYWRSLAFYEANPAKYRYCPECLSAVAEHIAQRRRARGEQD